jgi:hypothetical protein
MAGEAKQDPMVQALMDRGLRAYGGNSRLMDFQDPSKGIVASEAAPATLAEAVARLKSGQPGGAMNAASVAPATLTAPEQAAAQAAPSTDSDFDPTALLAAGGAGVAGYAAYRALHGRSSKPKSAINSPEFGATKNGDMTTSASTALAKRKTVVVKESPNVVRTPMPKQISKEIPEGEFTEVKGLAAALRNKALTRALPRLIK